MDDLKEVEERARLAVLYREEDSRKMVARLIKGIWLSIEEEKSELKKANIELEKELARSRTDALKEVRQLKTKASFDAERLFDEELNVIKADTYVEEEDEEAETVGIMDGLDGISHQMVLDNQGDNVELPEGGSEKAVREMSLRINNLESGLARERETFKALLSAQAELQVELDHLAHVRTTLLMCNREFAEPFRPDSSGHGERCRVKKGLKELAEVIERAEKVQRQVDAFAVKGKQTDTAQYHIQALEQSEERFRSDLQNCRNELERMRRKFA
ncbi:hypothetical protein GIB67_000827 [Kingdonia uniflora]|uniref:Uncharacterized protein n=1 Tax=Kingdonia uniflora TaxID=39325 RepID=A0A7J7NF04_9MAGN|nr:hypothetical protein GIB67_000827 [Kingdonia uniflora]